MNFDFWLPRLFDVFLIVMVWLYTDTRSKGAAILRKCINLHFSIKFSAHEGVNLRYIPWHKDASRVQTQNPKRSHEATMDANQ